MSKRRHFFSIRKKIFFSIAMTSAVVLLISTVISYFYFRDVLKKQVLTDQLQLANTCSCLLYTSSGKGVGRHGCRPIPNPVNKLGR